MTLLKCRALGSLRFVAFWKIHARFSWYQLFPLECESPFFYELLMSKIKTNISSLQSNKLGCITIKELLAHSTWSYCFSFTWLVVTWRYCRFFFCYDYLLYKTPKTYFDGIMIWMYSNFISQTHFCHRHLQVAHCNNN